MIAGALNFGGCDLRIVPPLNLVSPTQRCTHAESIRDIQRFRGAIYLADGAIPASALDEEARHRTDGDQEAFHFLLIDSGKTISGAIRLQFNEPSKGMEDSRIHEVIKRIPNDFRPSYDGALRQFISQVQGSDLKLGEVGGWAVKQELRRSIGAIILPLAAWAYCQLAGDAFILATATCRHLSARILTRMGGFALSHGGQELPPFYDPYYGCEMQLLGFDSRKPNPKYEPIIAELKDGLGNKLPTVFCHPNPPRNAIITEAVVKPTLALNTA
jgi:hypothetical protein